MMELKTFLNPDGEYARKKKKLIKKNNGFCLGEKHVEEWRCPCKSFRRRAVLQTICGGGQSMIGYFILMLYILKANQIFIPLAVWIVSWVTFGVSLLIGLCKSFTVEVQ